MGVSLALVTVLCCVLCDGVFGGQPHPRNNNVRRGNPHHHHRPNLLPFFHHKSRNVQFPPKQIPAQPQQQQIAGSSYHHQTHNHFGHHISQPKPGLASVFNNAYGHNVDPPLVSIAPIIPYEPQPQQQQHHHHYQPQHYPQEPVVQDYGPPPQQQQPHFEGTKVTKSVYVFSAPDDPSDHARPRQLVQRIPQERQRHYQVVFINAPEPPPHPQQTVELPQPPEVKTQVYVLVKKPQGAPPLKIIPPVRGPDAKPEVYFIKYKNEGGIPHLESPIPQPGPPPPSAYSLQYNEPGPSGDYGPPYPTQILDHNGIEEDPYAYGGPQHPHGVLNEADYVSQSGAFGYPHEQQQHQQHEDAYGDYSRLLARYASLQQEQQQRQQQQDAGIPGVHVLTRRRKVKVRRANKAMSDSNVQASSSSSLKWTPINKRDTSAQEIVQGN